MKFKRWVPLSFVLWFTLFSCKENSEATGPAESTPQKLSVEPNEGVIGTRIRISGASFDSLYWKNLVFFNGLAGGILPDNGDVHNLFVKVPFGARSGEIRIATDTTGNTYSTQSFSVLEDSPESTVVVKEYDLNYSLTEEMAALKDFDGVLRTWQGSVQGDTIILVRKGRCGDECSFAHRIKFLNTHSTLPQFISAVLSDTIHCCFPAIHQDSIKAGIVKIHDYRIPGLISGQIFYKRKNQMPSVLTFWYDFYPDE